LPLAPVAGLGAPFDPAEKAAALARAGGAGRPYAVDVGSRVITPGLQKPVPFHAGRAAVYLQFERPLTGAERGELTRNGVRFFAPISPNTYLARIRENTLNALRGQGLLRGIEPVEPADKLTEALFKGTVGRHAWNPDGTWSVHVRFYEDVALDLALAVLDAAGAQPEDRSRFLFNQRLLARVTATQVSLLAEDPAVASVEEVPPPPKTMNAQSAQISGVNVLQAAPYNLTGTGVRVGIWDGGPVRATHQDLTPRVTVVDNAGYNGNTNHSTHVAGTILSSGANNTAARGMAPAAGQLFSYDFNGDTTTEQADAANNSQILIANHSWGSVLGWDGTNNTGNAGSFGSYNGTAADWDTLVRNRGLVVVKSAGNDGNDCNPNNASDCDGVLGADGMRYDTIGTHGNAKNIITVGAINDDGTTLAAFSSAGPADDGRIKPDVVANGVNLTSTCNGSDSD